MPKGAETRLAYKASVTGGELKIQYFGLVASGQVKTVEEAVRGLVAGEAYVFVACRNDVRVKLEGLWKERRPHPNPSFQDKPQEGGDCDGKDSDTSCSHTLGEVGNAGPNR